MVRSRGNTSSEGDQPSDVARAIEALTGMVQQQNALIERQAQRLQEQEIQHREAQQQQTLMLQQQQAQHQELQQQLLQQNREQQQEFRQQILQLSQERSQAPPQPAEGSARSGSQESAHDRYARRVSEFQKLGPSSFYGGPETSIAES